MGLSLWEPHCPHEGVGVAVAPPLLSKTTAARIFFFRVVAVPHNQDLFAHDDDLYRSLFKVNV